MTRTLHNVMNIPRYRGAGDNSCSSRNRVQVKENPIRISGYRVSEHQRTRKRGYTMPQNPGWTSVLALISGLCSALVAVITFFMNRRNSIEAVRPVLVFTEWNHEDEGDRVLITVEKVRNVGKGPALYTKTGSGVVANGTMLPFKKSVIYNIVKNRKTIDMENMNGISLNTPTIIGPGDEKPLRCRIDLKWVLIGKSDNAEVEPMKLGHYSFIIFCDDVLGNRHAFDMIIFISNRPYRVGTVGFLLSWTAEYVSPYIMVGLRRTTVRPPILLWLDLQMFFAFLKWSMAKSQFVEWFKSFRAEVDKPEEWPNA